MAYDPTLDYGRTGPRARGPNYQQPAGSGDILGRATQGVKGYLSAIGLPGGIGGLLGGGGAFGGVTNFGPGFQGMPAISRPHMERPEASEFGMPSREGLDEIHGDLGRFREGYEHPTQTGAFANLMNLASTRTASAMDSMREEGSRAAQRRGFVGGFSGSEERAGRDRMRALAAEGFQAAGDIRAQEAEQYRAALQQYGEASGAFNAQMQERNRQYFDALQQARTSQTAADTAYNTALIEASKVPAEYLKSFGGLGGDILGGGLFGAAIGGARSEAEGAYRASHPQGVPNPQAPQAPIRYATGGQVNPAPAPAFGGVNRPRTYIAG